MTKSGGNKVSAIQGMGVAPEISPKILSESRR